MQDIDFASPSQGWAVGDFGRIVHSADGGSHWTSQDSHTTGTLWALDFIDADHGWASGPGIVLSTVDGGATWIVHEVPTIGDCRGMGFSDALHGWISDFRHLWATSDGGATWQALSSASLSGAGIVDVSVVDSATLYVALDGGILAASTDGGSTWTSRQVPDDWLKAVDAVDAKNAWALSGYGRIWATDDGGQSWFEQTTAATGSGAAYVDIAVLGQSGCAVGPGLLLTSRTGYGAARPPVTTIVRTPAQLLWADEHCASSATTLTFQPSDDKPGEVITSYSIDGGTWQPGLFATLGAPADHTNDGPHKVQVFSVDADGNDEVVKGYDLFIDTQPPTLTLSPAKPDMIGHWINHDSEVTLTPHDPAPSSGVWAGLREDGAWTFTSQVSVRASRKHENDGMHTLRVCALDHAGNIGGDQTYVVGIDTRKPSVTVPSPCRVHRGKTATVRFRVNDQKPCAGVAAVGVVILHQNGRAAKQFWPAKWYSANRSASYGFKCSLSRGTYRLLVYAADGAGNLAATPARSTFVVL